MQIKVISGGQSGVDQAGLYAAKLVGFETGGYMPKGFKTLDGSRPDLGTTYGLVEMSSEAYPPRTEANIKAADFTVQIAKDWSSPGELLTTRLLQGRNSYQVGYFASRTKEQNEDDIGSIVYNNIIKFNYQVINIAGNSEQRWPGAFDWASQFLKQVLLKVKEV